MADIIKEIIILERNAERRLEELKKQQLQLLENAKKYAIQDVAKAQTLATQEREQRIKEKQEFLETEKKKSIENAHTAAESLKQVAKSNMEQAVSLLIRSVT